MFCHSLIEYAPQGDQKNIHKPMFHMGRITHGESSPQLECSQELTVFKASVTGRKATLQQINYTPTNAVLVTYNIYNHALKFSLL